VQSSGPVRWGAVSLTLGGAVWLILGLSNVFGYLQEIPGREDVALLVVALLLTAAGLAGLHALQGESHGFPGRAGFCVALISLAARALLLGGEPGLMPGLHWVHEVNGSALRALHR
jgi:hypothetical protein